MKLYHGSKEHVTYIKSNEARKGSEDVHGNELHEGIYLSPDYGFAVAMAIVPEKGETEFNERTKTITLENPELFNPEEDIYVYTVYQEDVPADKLVHVDEEQYVVVDTKDIKPYTTEKLTSRDVLKYYTIENWQEEKAA